MPCNGGDDTFKGQPFFLRSAEDYREGLQSVPRADFGLIGEGHSWDVQTVDHQTEHQTEQHLEWPPQAPLGKVPSGWAERRSPLVSWIRSAGSSEETKRERERDPTTLPPVVVEMSTLWCISSGALCPLLVPSRGGESFWAWHPCQHVARRALDRLTDAEGNRIPSPESSTWEKADLALHPNAGAPSSEPITTQKNTKMEEGETDEKQKFEREDLCPIDSQVAASLTD
ncbi:uncharacterized protein LOC127979710 isoform X1 [Carassius gibelio]|uniref:uncharacterized protein LOC127979710 isoform X1 n=1 Tax=Carassius gibelio TaxID=101364 RepID=UPI0022775F54|nr:uncharacterized protein LOC127979710 isoform X1 [Carassius gibelio]